MNPVYIPASELGDWRKLLADPDKHWRENFSAMCIATAWHNAKGFPTAVAATFAAADEPFRSMVPLLIIPEHKVDLPGGRRASQNDVWVLARHRSGLASITVEGKVSESFGPTLREWQKEESAGKQERLDSLLKTLGLDAALPGNVRYQLLHRTASAVIEAKRFRADTALMLVHSFSPKDIGFTDFQAFVALFGKRCDVNQIVQIAVVAQISLYVGWVRDHDNFSPPTK